MDKMFNLTAFCPKWKKLTPADERNNDKVLHSDLPKHDDELLKHQHSLCPHPEHSSKSEVVDQC